MPDNKNKLLEYPRDLVGYNGSYPDPKWPRRLRVAVQFVLNYEEGAENCILHGDKGSETFLSEIIGAAVLKMHAICLWNQFMSMVLERVFGVF